MSIPQLTFAAVILSTLAGCAGTPDAPPVRAVSGLPALNVEKTDANADGNIDREEFNERLHHLFKSRDSDGSESLSPSELPEAKPSVYQKADQDNSGDLSKKEYLYMRSLDFNELDVDDDNVLYSREIIHWR